VKCANCACMSDSSIYRWTQLSGKSTDEIPQASWTRGHYNN